VGYYDCSGLDTWKGVCAFGGKRKDRVAYEPGMALRTVKKRNYEGSRSSLCTLGGIKPYPKVSSTRTFIRPFGVKRNNLLVKGGEKICTSGGKIRALIRCRSRKSTLFSAEKKILDQRFREQGGEKSGSILLCSGEITRSAKKIRDQVRPIPHSRLWFFEGRAVKRFRGGGLEEWKATRTGGKGISALLGLKKGTET